MDWRLWCNPIDWDFKNKALVKSTFLGLYLPILFLLPPRISFAEVQYQFTYAGQTFTTLTAAEAAMRSTSASHQYLKQTSSTFNRSTKLVEYSYSVPDRPAFQVGPTVYIGHNASCDPCCYSAADAYNAFARQQENELRHCNVVLTPLGGYSANFKTVLWAFKLKLEVGPAKNRP